MSGLKVIQNYLYHGLFSLLNNEVKNSSKIGQFYFACNQYMIKLK